MGTQFDDIAEAGRRQETGAGINQRQARDAEGRRKIRRLYAKRRLEQHPCAPVEKFEKPAVEHDAGGVTVPPLDGKAPPMNEFSHHSRNPKSGCRFSEKTMRNNKLKRNGGSTPIRFGSNHHGVAPVRSTAPRKGNPAAKIMTGELAPARHVPCAATRSREPGSNPPLDATQVAAVAPRPI